MPLVSGRSAAEDGACAIRLERRHGHGDTWFAVDGDGPASDLVDDHGVDLIGCEVSAGDLGLAAVGVHRHHVPPGRWAPVRGGLHDHDHPAALAVGLAGNFVLGALMTLGIGLYAPCLILVSLLGMDPRAAFPIMMGSCAFLMPVGSLQFVRKNAYNLRASLGLTIGGPLAVLIAAFIVESLPLFYVRWLVVVVVVYTAAERFYLYSVGPGVSLL